MDDVTQVRRCCAARIGTEQLLLVCHPFIMAQDARVCTV